MNEDRTHIPFENCTLSVFKKIYAVEYYFLSVYFAEKGFKTSFSKHVQSESVCKAIFRWILILCLKHEKILFRGFDHPQLKFHYYCQLRKRMWILFSCQQRLHGTLEPILWSHNNCQAPKYFIMMALCYHSDISYN